MHARLTLAATDPEPTPGLLAGTAREALAVFTRARDSLGIARASIRIAQEQQFQGRHAEAERLLSRALVHATRVQAEPERAMALGALGVSLCLGPIPNDRAVERCRALLAEHRGRRAAEVTLNCPLAVLLASRGQPESARACLGTADRIARHLGYAEAAVFIPLFTSAVETLAGNPGIAETLLREALVAADALGDAGLAGSVRRDLARVLLERGAVGEAPGLLGGSGADLPPSAAADVHGIGARLAAGRGERGTAVDLAAHALAAARRTDSPVVLATAELDGAHVLRILERPAAAAAAAARSAALFGRKRHVVGERWARTLLAELSDGADR
jgi:ATP/maltotriose-dependent transcriptional regulator MalT